MTYRIVQGGQVMAKADTHADAVHYANVYRQDGRVVLEQKKGRKWTLMAIYSHTNRQATR